MKFTNKFIENRPNFSFFLKVAYLCILFSFILFSGCSKFKIAIPEDPILNNLAVESFQNMSITDVPTDKNGRIWTRSKTLTLNGKCTRGVYSVQAMDQTTGQPAGPSVRCGRDKSYQWTYNVPADGIYTFLYLPTLRSGLTLPPMQKTYVVSTLPPPPPVILTNGGNSFTSLVDTIEITGTFFFPGIDLISSSNEEFLYVDSNGGTFSKWIHLSPGEARTNTFWSVDGNGVLSLPVRITISYGTQLRLTFSRFSGTATLAPVSSGAIQLKSLVLIPSQVTLPNINNGLILKHFGLGVSHED